MANFLTAYCDSPIGIVKIMADEHCITAVSFVDAEDGERIASPGASPLLQQCLYELKEFFNGDRREFSVPVQQPGTPFQQQVWKQVAAIPFGKTVSYLALSKQLGDSKAIRAAAASNGKNKLGILVPCHRVVGSNGDMVGYAWGTWRKQWLLQHEARFANGVQTLFELNAVK